MKSSTRRLTRASPRAETEEEKRRRLQATSPSDQSPSEQNKEKRNDENEGPMNTKDEGETEDGIEVEEDEDKKEKKKDDEEVNGEERANARALRNDAVGDRAAERDDLISAYRDCERARIKAILTSPEAKDRDEAAKGIALETTVPRDQAIAMLKMSPRVPKTGGIGERMQGNNVPNVGPADPVKERASREAVALAITNAGRKARGEKLLTELGATTN